MNKRESVVNYLKAVNFQYPEWIPAYIGFLPATWLKQGKELEKVILEHPVIFPRYKAGDYKKIQLDTAYTKGEWVDVWGTTWRNIEEGMDSIPVDELAPLSDWDRFQDFLPPDPVKYDQYGREIDWDARKKRIDEMKKAGSLGMDFVLHGAMYMRLFYLRGFANFLMDIALKEPALEKLIEMVLNYNLKLIRQLAWTGVEIIHFGDDLGIQNSLLISPADWRRYLKPCFMRMFQLCRQNDIYVHLHTDGYILDIIPDLIECGVNVLNPQLRPNTLKGLERCCKGRVAVLLDLDRQMFPFASPGQIRAHIKESIETLALPEGGLLLICECGPDITLDKVEEICKAYEDFNCRGT